MMEAETVGRELASEKGGHHGREGVVEATFGGDVVAVYFEDVAQLSVTVCAVAGPVEGLKLTHAARFHRDSIGPKGREGARAAGAHSLLQSTSNKAEAGIDNKGGAKREGNAVSVVGAEAELKAAEKEGRGLEHVQDVHAAGSGLHEVRAGVIGEGFFAQGDGGEQALVEGILRASGGIRDAMLLTGVQGGVSK